MEDYDYEIYAPPIRVIRSDEDTKVLLGDLTIDIHAGNIYAHAGDMVRALRSNGVWQEIPDGFLVYYTSTEYNIVWYARDVAISVSDGYLRTVDYEHTHLDISPSGEILEEKYNAPIRRFSPKIE